MVQHCQSGFLRKRTRLAPVVLMLSFSDWNHMAVSVGKVGADTSMMDALRLNRPQAFIYYNSVQLAFKILIVRQTKERFTSISSANLSDSFPSRSAFPWTRLMDTPCEQDTSAKST